MPTRSSTIVFRQWSRKGYAVFAGLVRHVVIGVLSVDLYYAAMLKTGVEAVAQATDIAHTTTFYDDTSPQQPTQATFTNTTFSDDAASSDEPSHKHT